MEYDYSCPYSWPKLLSLALFVFLSQGSLNSSRVEPPQIRPVFVPRNFVLNNQIQRYLNLKHLKQSRLQLEKFFGVLPPHQHFSRVRLDDVATLNSINSQQQTPANPIF
jgi:hypothetical protein